MGLAVWAEGLAAARVASVVELGATEVAGMAAGKVVAGMAVSTAGDMVAAGTVAMVVAIVVAQLVAQMVATVAGMMEAEIFEQSAQSQELTKKCDPECRRRGLGRTVLPSGLVLQLP